MPAAVAAASASGSSEEHSLSPARRQGWTGAGRISSPEWKQGREMEGRFIPGVCSLGAPGYEGHKLGYSASG